MINLPSLTRKLKALGHPPESWLPLDYRPKDQGGNGRTKHDDWFMLKSTPRLSTAYAVPLPFRRIAGTQEPELIPVMNDLYPILPGTPIEMRVAWDNVLKVERPMRHVLSMTMMADPGKWARVEAFLGGEWTECLYMRTVTIFGKMWKFHAGLKLDPDGPMAWFPEVGA